MHHAWPHVGTAEPSPSSLRFSPRRSRAASPFPLDIHTARARGERERARDLASGPDRQDPARRASAGSRDRRACLTRPGRPRRRALLRQLHPDTNVDGVGPGWPRLRLSGPLGAGCRSGCRSCGRLRTGGVAMIRTRAGGAAGCRRGRRGTERHVGARLHAPGRYRRPFPRVGGTPGCRPRGGRTIARGARRIRPGAGSGRRASGRGTFGPRGIRRPFPRRRTAPHQKLFRNPSDGAVRRDHPRRRGRRRLRRRCRWTVRIEEGESTSQDKSDGGQRHAGQRHEPAGRAAEGPARRYSRPDAGRTTR